MVVALFVKVLGIPRKLGMTRDDDIDGRASFLAK
jgi:hypothetical protein